MATASRSPTTKPGKSAGSGRPAVSTTAQETAARRQVIATAQALGAAGLSPGRSGNVSRRWADGMLITPSGMAYHTLKPSDIVFVGRDGGTKAKARKPSSEWRFHVSAYQARPDRNAVVHTHSLNATALACQHMSIPAFHYMVAAAGGHHIPCIAYAAFGTAELAQLVADGLSQHDACLMANHGQIAIGSSLEGALELAAEVENLAAQYIRVRALGKPKLLSSAQMDDVIERFRSYGQNAQNGAGEV